jgi:tripartite ATP-independent transporter DctM subunit
MLGAACGTVLALLLAVASASTLQRYALGSGYIGAEEAMVWLLLLLACLGFPLVANGPLSMRIDLFAGRQDGALQELRALVAEAIVLGASLALASAGTKAALHVGGVSPLLGLGEWIRPAALALSGVAAFAMRILALLDEGRAMRLAAATDLAVLAWAVVVSGISPLQMPPSLAAAAIVGLGILVGAPLPHAFILAGYLALASGSPLVEPALALSLLGGMGRYLLLAIPFFLLAGGLLVVSGMAGDLVRFAAALVGARRAGLGQTVLLTSLLFSGISGSSIANAAFSSKTFLNPLVAHGYAPERAGAIIAATAVLDNIVPPSIAFFILATATNLPVGPLLVGGLFAGLLLAAALAVAIHFTASTAEIAPRETSRLHWRLVLRAMPVFGLGLIVVAGIRFGLVTPTEAAAVAAAYTLASALLLRSSLSRIAAAFAQAGTETAAIVMLVGAATPLAFLLVTDGIAGSAAGLALSLGENPFMVMIAANLLLLAVGLVLDIGAAILLFSPILLPAAVAVGIDPVHFGVILVVNLMIGGLTPPVGILVQVVSAATGLPAVSLFRTVLPYLSTLLAALFSMGAGIAAHAYFFPA